MTDYATLLPIFYTDAANETLLPHLPILEDHDLSLSDILTIDPVDLSIRTKISLNDINALIRATVDALNASHDPSRTGLDLLKVQNYVSLGNAEIDMFLGGGIMTGSVVEVVGESGAGKTQFLLSLLLTIQLPPHDRSSIYITTEDLLPTTRLVSMMEAIQSSHPYSPLTTDRVHTVLCQTPAKLERVIQYELPIAIERYNIGLVVLDSIAANFRGEDEKVVIGSNRGKSLAKRGGEVVRLGNSLRDIAVKHNVAVVVANQVADRFLPRDRDRDRERTLGSTQWNGIPTQTQTQGGGGGGGSSNGGTPYDSQQSLNILTYDHQQRWFTGWGDEGDGADEKGLMASLNQKTPVLGMIWSNLITARIVLLKGYEGRDGRTRRWMKVVFAPWAESGVLKEYEIWEGGLRAVSNDTGRQKNEDESEYGSLDGYIND